ncbi:M28 family peptidase [Saccharicrinis sp. FJH54]|uniref:M28 family peptidase n=1 Tax=Saccharicrinis sp. FJH54 TaxID=3344665 RepID=UPI0035D4CCC2
MEIKINKLLLIIALPVFLTGCPKSNTVQKVSEPETVKKQILTTPPFNPDSAYTYIAEQVAFGPRVMNSAAHTACGDYLVRQMKRFGAKVYEQKADLTGFDNTVYKARNIIGSFNPELQQRVMLCAHWDSRMFADQEKDESLMKKPIDGANDGASGVGVLMELARQIGQHKLPFGVDIIFFDAEDQGQPHFLPASNNSADTWCLGSQYWSKHPHKENYWAQYGILLDMVGAENAIFPMEGFSMENAPELVNKVWNLASEMGYGQYFLFERSAPVTDDHYYVTKGSGIPCIDIIHYHRSNRHGFGDFWHTHDDTMDIIYKPTLYAVGSVLLEHLYQQPF